MSFGRRADAALRAYGPLCVGVDPHAELLEQWGVGDSLAGLTEFAARCVDAFAGRVGFVKPQAAFFERFGAAGVAVLEQTLADFRHTGTLTILDVKRGDIGSTARAYAEAYLDDDAPMAADAMTVSPYLGFGSLTPFFEVAEHHDAGVFVLARTSNPEAAEFQSARTSEGQSVASAVLSQLADANAPYAHDPMGPFGAVVGATLGGVEENLDMGGPILVPGFGAQGGTAADIARLFDGVMDRVIVSSSRGVLRDGPSVDSLRAAADRATAELVGSRA